MTRREYLYSISRWEDEGGAVIPDEEDDEEVSDEEIEKWWRDIGGEG